MAETRLGRQTPTVSVVLPYTESKGAEAIALYNKSGRTALDWQALILEDIMALDDNGLWLHMKFAWSVPRRNGKSEDLVIRSMYGVTHGERILYTAHRATTSHNAWEKVIERLSKAGYVEDEDFKTYKRYGLETIHWLNGEGVIHFRTRSSKGGLGEGFDLLIIDEAQEYTSDQESALKYVVTDSKNPQTLMCGTPPTAVSSGTVFLTYRRDTLTGKNENAGWAEWSVPRLSDAHDPELWYETNPSLGTILTERTIRSELGNDQTDDNIQRLGLWLTYSQKSAISEREWMQFKIESLPELKQPVKIFYGVKFAKTSGNVSLACAVRTADKKIFVEALDCRPVRDGLDWIIAFLRNSHAEKIAIDGAAGASLLVQNMKDADVHCKVILPKVSEIIEANSLFEQNLFAGEICHAAQPSLVQAVTNCEHRAIGAGGGFGYASILENADISLVEAVTLAHWICANTKDKKKQIITY
ncbi:MAG: terminase [Ruminococcus sp.]|nr:terminase [Ruminococcus sp.]